MSILIAFVAGLVSGIFICGVLSALADDMNMIDDEGDRLA